MRVFRTVAIGIPVFSLRGLAYTVTMGIHDRDYVRMSNGRGPQSNPLWWILGLVAVIVVLSLVRRGSMPEVGQGTAGIAAGPVRTCVMQFARDEQLATKLIPALRSFFHEQGYDSTIHEAANGTLSSAAFMQTQRSLPLAQTVNYRFIADGHETLPGRHELQFHVFHQSAEPTGEAVEESQRLSEELRLRLEQQLPGAVIRVDSEPVPVSFNDLD